MEMGLWNSFVNYIYTFSVTEIVFSKYFNLVNLNSILNIAGVTTNARLYLKMYLYVWAYINIV